ncbi:MAG TPA: hypothetical protein VM076_23490 [Gemmatimonadaceae bacterium]|nr:hypothetical protein [Gemmatimonadaceae bacterium]
MAIWDKLKTELDRAGKAAQSALDEGKIRLEAFRTRQLADKAAQALGYAVYRAKQSGGDIDPESYARLSATLATHEAEATRLEQQLRDIAADKPEKDPTEPPAPPPSSTTSSASPGTTPPPEAPAM